MPLIHEAAIVFHNLCESSLVQIDTGTKRTLVPWSEEEERLLAEFATKAPKPSKSIVSDAES